MQAPPRRDASVDLRKFLCLQQRVKNGGVGVGEIAMIAKNRRNWKTLPLINTDNTDPKGSEN
jgi:hypothetical protein